MYPIVLLAAALGQMLPLFGFGPPNLRDDRKEAASAPAASRPADPDDPRSPISLEDFPAPVAERLRAASDKIAASEMEAGGVLERYLHCEKTRLYTEAFSLIDPEIRSGFLKNARNRAIVNQVLLYKRPPEKPTVSEQEAIARARAMVAAKHLTPEIEDPALWVYQWTHWTGSIEADFAVTGPYANHFRLADFHIVRVTLAPDNPRLALCWVDETIEAPDAIRTVRLSEFLLHEDGGRWSISGHRPLSSVLLYSWLGERTFLWPDEAAMAAGMDSESSRLKERGQEPSVRKPGARKPGTEPRNAPATTP